ncbi:MAG: PqqD family protein [Clostridia bacterium]|nr:PqqD family protein [Clostridia bacterium]
MKIKKGFVIRKVGDAHVVVPVGELSKTFHGMINLNETGAFLWKFFTAEHSVNEAVAALCAEYEVDEERARIDAEKFAEVLTKNSFIE